MEKKIHLLIVDDDAALTHFCRKVVEKYACRATVASGVEEAVRTLSADTSIDFVLSDVQMPGVDGWTLLSWMKQNRPGCPVGLMTGIPYVSVRETAVKAGAVGVLMKPFSPDDLCRFVRSHLGVSAGFERKSVQ
ncbi:MAG TPA: response regulator [Elusimicrobiota bacterium]|nr:response regulator [Elusimicrobiota bacterium]